MNRIACRPARASSPASPEYASSSARSPSSPSSWLAAKLPRSNIGSPIPAYSQSTIRSRSPSCRKFAFSRSLWHGRSSTPARDASISAARLGRPAVFLDHAEGVEAAGDRRTVVDGADRPAGVRRVELPGGDGAALDEPRHEAAVDEVDDLGPDADRVGDARRLRLVAPVDPEQRRVLAADADDVALAADRHFEVVVGDPAAEPLDGRFGAGPEPFDDAGDLVHVRRPPSPAPRRCRRRTRPAFRPGPPARRGARAPARRRSRRGHRARRGRIPRTATRAPAGRSPRPGGPSRSSRTPARRTSGTRPPTRPAGRRDRRPRPAAGRAGGSPPPPPGAAARARPTTTRRAG